MQLDAASKKKLEGVQPELLRVVEKAAELAGADSNLDFSIVQGNRTQAYQDWLYAQGRTRPGQKVTWTRNSKHIGGRAIDFAALDNGKKVSWDTHFYPQIAHEFEQAAHILKIGIEWGGDWKTKDWGHIQLNPSNLNKVAMAGGVTVPAYKTLSLGMHGEQIEGLQELLVGLGYTMHVDGDFGKATELAVRSFQGHHSLVVDGKVGPLTWTLMNVKPAVQLTLRQPIATLRSGVDYDRIVRHYEGEKLRAYQIGGEWHIGVGHSGGSGHPPFPSAGMVITPVEMNQIFKTDTLRAEEALKKIIHVPLTPKQFDALLSLYFNRSRTYGSHYVGPGSDLDEAVNAEDWNRAELEFKELANAPALDGKHYSGLTARRQTEEDLFMGRAYELR